MNKPALVAAILEKLRDEFESRQAASKSTRAAGNDSESKAENKYDTQSIEQNYLADGLAKQAQIAAQAADAYEKLILHDFAPNEPIDLGALVEIQVPSETEWFFLGPAAGGIELVHEGHTIIVITPESPLGSQLLDRRAADSIAALSAKILVVC
ncbi:MAG: transcription elongation factor GreAB [Chthoniobacterales bacterium]